MKAILLGSGTSTGVPRLGNDWGQCDPTEPRNRRTRVSALIETGGKRFLIDTSPDLRQQLLANNIASVDAVLWTHDHADHCHGIDDLRVMRYGRSNPLPGFASPRTCARLKRRFDYVFAGQYGYPTIVDLNEVSDPRLILGVQLRSVEMPHGEHMTSTGYLLENDGLSVAYATDFNRITSDMIATFAGVDLLFCDCLRRNPHPTHASLDLALELAKVTKARTTVLMHLDKSMDYRTLSAELPTNVVVGYDGLEVTL